MRWLMKYIHSAQFYIKCIHRVILVNLLCRPLKLGRLYCSTGNTPKAIKTLFPWQLTLFQSPPSWFQYVSDFQVLNIEWGHKLELAHLFACWIKHMRHHLQISKWDAKVARNAFNIGKVWNPVCCHGNQTVVLILWGTFSTIVLQRIKHLWYKLAEISFFIIFDQNVIECWISSLGLFAYFENLNISGRKRDIWI